MRLRTDIWVKAYIRRCAVQGAPAVVVRHGDDHAGAIFIRIAMPDRHVLLFGPAPAGHEEASHGRRFAPWGKGERLSEQAADAALAKEIRFDSDLWIVEVEDREGRHFLDGEIVSPV